MLPHMQRLSRATCSYRNGHCVRGAGGRVHVGLGTEWREELFAVVGLHLDSGLEPVQSGAWSAEQSD